MQPGLTSPRPHLLLRRRSWLRLPHSALEDAAEARDPQSRNDSHLRVKIALAQWCLATKETAVVLDPVRVVIAVDPPDLGTDLGQRFDLALEWVAEIKIPKEHHGCRT